MASTRIRGVRLTREERLAVRRLISAGCRFEEAAATVTVFDKDGTTTAEYGWRHATATRHPLGAATVVG
jgi:hypothetical protein